MKKKLAKKRLFAPCSHCVDECTHQPIQVLIVKPHLRPYGATICPSLRSMQDIVGGYIQVVHDGLLKDDAVIVCNEEGKLACVECMDCIRGLPANRALRDSRSKVQYVICGTFMVVGTAGEDFTSLTPRQFADWTDRFLYCEQMIYFDDKIVAIPIADGSAEAEDEKHE
jgi:hypothetical protein